MSTPQTTPVTSVRPSSSSSPSPNTRTIVVILGGIGVGVCFILVSLAICQQSATCRRVSLFNPHLMIPQPPSDARSITSFYVPRNPDTTSIVSHSRCSRAVSGQSATAGIGDFFNYQQQEDLRIHPSLSASLVSSSETQYNIEAQLTPSVMFPLAHSFPSPRSPSQDRI